MGRIALLSLVLAVAAVTFGALHDDRSDGGRNRASEPSQRYNLWPTFDADSPRRPAPQVSISDLSGNTYYLGEFQGQVLLVNFWATWCAPCRRELPSLLRLQDTLSGEGFRVVMISTDRQGADIVRPFLEANGLDALRTYLDPDSEAYAGFGAEALPTTILIDRLGREIGRHRGAVQWDNSTTVANIRQILMR